MVTVAICTYNRAGMLRDCVGSVCGQDPGLAYEVLIVDNNSTDDTAAVAEEYSEQYPFVRYVCEYNQGIAHARNRALREARGAIVAFVDDDELAEEDWLRQLIAPFEDEKIGCVGGPYRLRFESERPSWMSGELPTELLGYLGGNLCDHEHGSEVRSLNTGNFAVRRELALAIGAFRCDLGYVGDQMIPGEDTEFCYRIAESGYRVYFTNLAAITHRISLELRDRKWFLERARAQGIASAKIEQLPTNPGQLLADALYAALRAAGDRVGGDQMAELSMRCLSTKNRVRYWHSVRTRSLPKVRVPLDCVSALRAAAYPGLRYLLGRLALRVRNKA